MASPRKKTTPQFTYEKPIMYPEISNISGNETHLVLKFGYRRNNYDENSYIISSSIAMTHEQAEKFANQILETLERIENL